MKKILIYFIYLSFVVCFDYQLANSWDNETIHQELTKQAFEYLIDNRLLIGFPYFPGVTDSIESSLSLGAENEDSSRHAWRISGSKLPCQLLGGLPTRVWFHFYPAMDADAVMPDLLHSSITLALFWLGYPINVQDKVKVKSTCSSVEWGFDDIACTGSATIKGTADILIDWEYTNKLKWSDAIDNAGTSQGWYALGHVLHLLEDLTVPAHVRNDPHGPGELDPLEIYAKDESPELFSGDLVSLETTRDYFHNLQRYTQENFFSDDTCFHPDFIGPTAFRNDNDYFYDQKGRKIAHKGAAYYYSGKNRRACAINMTIAKEQFSELSVKAEQYAASLIKHYYDQAIQPNIKKTFIIPAIDSGWYNETGIHDANNENYIVGTNWASDHRNFFVFDLRSIPDFEPSEVGLEAYLEVFNPEDGFVSPQGFERYDLFDVTTPIEELRTQHPAGEPDPDIYQDLGTGILYGDYDVDYNDNNSFIRFPLDPLFFRDMFTEIGPGIKILKDFIAIGGAIGTIDSVIDEEFIFGSTGDPSNLVRLIFIFTFLPV